MKPGLLLVEDDPTSMAYLAMALEPLGLPVRTAANGDEARVALELAPHVLWLVDAHLPDCSGAVLLGRLRARSPGVPAVAHTASPAPDLHRALVDAGFAEVVVKPVDVATWQATVRRHLPASVADPAPPYHAPGVPVEAWCDPGSVAPLGGVPSHVTRLRRRFLQELPAQRIALAAAADAGDAAAMAACLHRLAASCAFVGATELARCVGRLRDAPDCPRAFDAVACAIRALEASGSGD